MRRPYPFRNPGLRALVKAVDFFGDLFERAVSRGVRPPLRRGADYRRVVLIRLDHIGDGLFTLPSLVAARDVFPNAHITLVAGSWAEDLVRPLGCVDDIKVFRAPWFERSGNTRLSFPALQDLTGILREGAYELAIDFRGDARHLLAMKAAQVPDRVGYGTTGFGFLLTHELQADPFRHEVESAVECLRPFQKDLVASPLPEIPVSPDSEMRVDALLKDAGIPSGDRLMVIQFAAGYPSKDWGDDLFADLLKTITNLGNRAVLVGVPKDYSRAEKIAQQTGIGVSNLCGQTDLGDLVTLLKRAAVYIGLDSGPSHLAVAMGTPSVLLYGDVNDLRRWGPWTLGRENRVRLFHQQVPCGPCGLADCPKPDHGCLNSLMPLEVSRAVKMMMDGSYL